MISTGPQQTTQHSTVLQGLILEVEPLYQNQRTKMHMYFV